MDIPESKAVQNKSFGQNSSRNASVQNCSFYQSNESQVNGYKKKLLNIVVGISVVIMLIIIERIFYEFFISNEVTLLHNLQKSLNLISEATMMQGDVEVTYWQFRGSWIWSMFGYMDLFKYNFLLLTAFLGIFFVSVDALIAVKVGYMGVYGYFMLTAATMIYAGPRPFWQSGLVGSPVCLNTYSHPSRNSFLMYFVIFYTVFCFRRRVQNRDVEETARSSRIFMILEIFLGVFILGMLSIKYIIGADFLLNITLGLLYFLIYFYFLKFMDSYIDSLIQKSTIQERSAKKYVFYWFLYLILSATVATVIYSSQDYFEPTEWIKNYLLCTQANGTLVENIAYDEILGPWFTFIQSSCIFGLIGAIFGVAYTYRNTAKNYNWFAGPLKKRIYRALLVLLSLVPSWIFSIFQNDIVQSSWVRQVGINEYFISIFHYFFLYYFIFGILPAIFKRMSLIEDVDTDAYNVLQTNKNISFLNHYPQNNSYTNNNAINQPSYQESGYILNPTID